jgi:hypothetical protein
VSLALGVSRNSKGWMYVADSVPAAMILIGIAIRLGLIQ